MAGHVDPDPMLGERFLRALALALELHADHARKRTRVPYLSHLLAVTALVLEHGGDEDTACAAMLHDGPEDRGGEPVLARIRAELGERVAGIVLQCSEPLEYPRPRWEERKRRYLEGLAEAGPEARLVAAADKLHNVTRMVLDLRSDGLVVWEHFSRGPEATLRFYREALAVLEAGVPETLVQRLREGVEALAEQIARMPRA